MTRPRLLNSTVLLLLGLGYAGAADWTQWRGPHGNGTTTEAVNHPAGWPPKRLWQASVGTGCTSPLLIKGKAYVLGYHGPKGGKGSDRLSCLDSASGRLLWQQSYPARYQSRLRTGDTGAYGGPAASPAYDPQTGYLYTLGIDGELRCWDIGEGGRTIWRLDLHNTFPIAQRPLVGGGLRDFGFTAAPLLHGNALIVEVGSSEGTLVAFDKATGKRLWSSAYRGPAGHSGSLLPFAVGGEPCLAFLALREVVLVRTVPGHEGETLATYGRTTEYGCNIPSPAPYGDSLLLTSAYNYKSSELVSFAGKTPVRRWTTKEHALVSTPLIHGDRAYIIAGQLRCIDLATGKRIWSGGSFRHGTCLLAADNKLIVHGNRRIALVDASPTATAYRELARIDAVGKDLCYPQIALANGLLVAKDKAGNLFAFDLNTKAPQDKTARTALPPPKLGDTWPGTREGTVFLCPDTDPDDQAFLMPRDAPDVLDGRILDLADGAFLVEGKDEELLAACRKSNALAIEAIITPDDLKQRGPARIISFSQDAMLRNFTLGQERNQLILRLRTPKTGTNGSNPQTVLCRLADTKPHHVIVSYREGELICYLDGKQVLKTDRIRGDFRNWEPMHLILGDEYEDERNWSGQLQRIAILARPIGPAEAKARHQLAQQ